MAQAYKGPTVLSGITICMTAAISPLLPDTENLVTHHSQWRFIPIAHHSVAR